MAEGHRQQRRGLRLGLAVAVMALMLCVVGASAWLRLAQPRLGCAEWPTCRDAAALLAARAAPPPAADERLGAPRTLQVVRAVHRVAATTVLLLVVALAVLLWRERPRNSEVRELLRPALALLAGALALSMLGVVTPGSRALGVLLGNLLGGVLMLALAVALTARVVARRALPHGLARHARLTFGLWLVQAALGAMSGAGALHLAPPFHLALAAVALPMAWGVGWSARRTAELAPEPVARWLGTTLLFLVPLQFVFGASAAAQGAQMVWVLAHNVSAATGLGVLCALAALRSEKAHR